MQIKRPTAWFAAAVSIGLLSTIILRSTPRQFEIVEGPFVQLSSTTGVNLVWFGNQEAQNEVSITNEGVEILVASVPHSNLRFEIAIDGLDAGHRYEYSIAADGVEQFRSTFATSKTENSQFRILVFGDSGTGSRAQYRLAAEMTSTSPDLILHTGDLVYEHGERSGYRARFFRPYADLISRVNLWPALGNHDIHAPEYGQAYFDVFTLPENGPGNATPEQHYWFDYASARIAVINSNAKNDETEIADVSSWLNSVFTDDGPGWKFLSTHHCPYSTDHFRPMLRKHLVPVLEKVGVHVVFCGHDHFYMRTHPIRGGQAVAANGGPVYVVSGAGADLADAGLQTDIAPLIAVVNDESLSYTVVDVDDRQLTLRQIAPSGRVIDDWTLSRINLP